MRCKTASENFLSSLFDQVSLDNIAAIRHGRSHESVAREEYMQLKAVLGESVSIRSCGIVLHTQCRYFGASPDGCVHDPSSSEEYGQLEIKCAYRHFSESKAVEEACAQPDFCCEFVDGKVCLRRSHQYFYQVQGQMAVCGVPWWVFFGWIGERAFLERIPFSNEVWTTEMLPSLVSFYHKMAVPYLAKKGRPPPHTSMVEPNAASQEQFETLLQPNLCQSKIDSSKTQPVARTFYSSWTCKATGLPCPRNLPAVLRRVQSNVHHLWRLLHRNDHTETTRPRPGTPNCCSRALQSLCPWRALPHSAPQLPNRRPPLNRRDEHLGTGFLLS